MAEAFGLAVNIATVIDLFVKVGVQCSVYCADVKTAPREIRYILNEADRLGATLLDLDKLIAGPHGSRIQTSKNVCSSVEECRLLLDSLAAKLKQGTKWQKLVFPLKKQEVSDVVGKLERCRATISLDLQISQVSTLSSIHREIIQAKLRVVDRAAFDSHADTDRATCYPGTRVDLLSQLTAWLSAPSGRSIFWLNGMAGTGKSTISRTIAKQFAETGSLGASFFFKQGEGDRGRATCFFPTIISQLIQQIPALAPLVCDQIKADPAIHNKLLADQFQKLIAIPLETLSTQPSHSAPAFTAIVVDALDECDNLDDIRLIIHLLSQLRDPVWLKFFVTSRPELPIQLGFKQIDGTYEDLMLQEIPRPTIEHDIRIFLEHELSKIREDYNRFATADRRLPLDWPGRDVQKLVHISTPLFIYAATICRFLQDRRLGGPKEQLANILEHDQSHESNLDATYLPVLNRLLLGLSRSSQEKIIERFKRIVGSIVILGSPLSKASLSRLIDLSVDVVQDQLDLFHSVLNIPPDPDKPVQLLHLSFRDFLVDPEKATQTEKYPFWVDRVQTHLRLAARCLQLLSQDNVLKKDICNIGYIGTPRADIKPQIIEEYLPPEVQYACQYWVFHWKESKRLVEDGDSAHLFLKRNLLFWLEALSLLGRVPEGIGMIRDLQGLLKPNSSDETAAFLYDLMRILLHHRLVIENWPLQLYYSVLIFTTEQSLVRKTYQCHMPGWLSLLPQVDPVWDSCLQTLEEHSEEVFPIAASPDFRRLATGSRDCTAKLWDVATGACIATLEGHSSDVNTVAFSPDSTLVASGSADCSVKLWDSTTGACIKTLRGHTSMVLSVAFSPDSTLLVSVTDHDIMMLWDILTDTCNMTLEREPKVLSLAFSSDSSLLVLGLSGHIVELWDVTTGACTLTIRDTEAVSLGEPVAWSFFPPRTIILPDSSLVATDGSDGTLKLWNVATRSCTTIQVASEGWAEDIEAVAISADSSLLALGGVDGALGIWEIATGTCIVIQKSNLAISCVAISYDLSLLIIGSVEGIVRLWDMEDERFVAGLEGHTSRIYNTLCLPNGLLASSSDDYTVRLWDTSDHGYSATFEGHVGEVMSVAFSPTSSQFASGSADCSVKIWNAETGAFIRKLDRFDIPANGIGYSPDGSRLGADSDCGAITVWDMETGCCIIREYHESEYDWESSKYIVFDETNSTVHSSQISLSLVDGLPATRDHTPPEPDEAQDIGLSEDGKWITWQSRNILWLPAGYRPTCWAAKGSTLVVGGGTGRVYCLTISPNVDLGETCQFQGMI